MFATAYSALRTAPRKLALAGITAAFATTVSAPPAAAWGVKEQQFLAGVLTTLAIGGLVISSNQQAKQQTSYATTYPTTTYYGSYHGGNDAYQDSYYPSKPVYAAPPQHHYSIYDSAAAKAFDSFNYNKRLRIQATLANYGYYHGAIDGNFGPETYRATKAYAHNTGKTNLLGSKQSVRILYNGLLA